MKKEDSFQAPILPSLSICFTLQKYIFPAASELVPCAAKLSLLLGIRLAAALESSSSIMFRNIRRLKPE